MTTSSAERQPDRQPLPVIVLPGMRWPVVSHYLRPARPLLVERSARGWWLALACWFAGSALGQVLHSPAAVGFHYRYIDGAGAVRLDDWALPGPLAVVLFGLLAVFLASLVLPMRDGAGWARTLLTVLAIPLAAVVVWQIARCLFTGVADGVGVGQGLLGLVALGVLPGAVGMMYRREVRAHYRR
jgi:hypothetical protein